MTDLQIFTVGPSIALVGRLDELSGTLTVAGPLRWSLGTVRIDVAAQSAAICVALPAADVAVETDVALETEVVRLTARLVRKLAGCTQISFRGVHPQLASDPQLAAEGFRAEMGLLVRSGGQFESTRKASNPVGVYHDPFDVPWNFVPAEAEVYHGIEPSYRDVLDLGCGYGKNAVQLASQGHRVTGVDIAPAAVSTANRFLADIGEFHLASATDLPFTRASFDAVVDVGCLHCLDPGQRPPALAEIARVLRPGGLLRTRIFKPKPASWLESMPFRADSFGVSSSELEELFDRFWELAFLADNDDFHLLECRVR